MNTFDKLEGFDKYNYVMGHKEEFKKGTKMSMRLFFQKGGSKFLILKKVGVLMRFVSKNGSCRIILRWNLRYYYQTDS